MESHHGTLVANTVDTIDLASDYGAVEVLNRGDDAIFFSVDASAPTVEGTGDHIAPAHSSAVVAVTTDGDTVVKLISAGTPKFTVLAGEKVQRQGLAADAGSSSSSPITVAGQLVVVSAEFARPADTTAYAAKDAISTAAGALLDFDNVARANGGSGYLVKARAMTDDTAIAAPPRVRLHLFHTAPAAVADNAAYPLLYANRANRVGFVDFPVVSTEGAGSTAMSTRVDDLRLPFKCAAADRDLYGILETLDAFTPASAKNWFVELTADLN